MAGRGKRKNTGTIGCPLMAVLVLLPLLLYTTGCMPEVQELFGGINEKLHGFLQNLNITLPTITDGQEPQETQDSGCGFQVHYLDVGQADAAVIVCDGHYMMIDGGNTADSRFIYSYLKNTLGAECLDMVIGTHAHEDHIGGIPAAFNACAVKYLCFDDNGADIKSVQNVWKQVNEKGIRVLTPKPGTRFMLGSAEVECLGPVKHYENENDNSVVVKITYGETSFLFMADAEWESECDLIDNGADLNSTVLKVGHHGSEASSSYLFLQEVMPEYAVISVGENNTYGHPTDEALSRLSDAGAVIYRTDHSGTIVCSSDGENVMFRFEKGTGSVRPVYTTEPKENKSVKSGDAQIIYVGNKNKKRFHSPDCSSVTQMKENNKVYFESRQEAVSAGYTACGNCNP